MTDGDRSTAPRLESELRSAITDALRYWERRRLLYNAVLTLVVVAYFVMNWSRSLGTISLEGALANICYCAAYPVDVFVQISRLRQGWKAWRWALFVIGTAFAAVLTRWFAIGFFGPITP